ncbi:MAG: hypothetical protein KA085_11700 [Phenylobacterium sp.]|jgi:hypothetical protein|uniref:hypothetical protein n=1 Tax=Phenylobacterium sp. TaxID=1871053 RepID=UPI001B4138E5|nr:hypothetical protein [Phenylobacterium sp.]MBP7651070.1 hypothetical protein [Phenylobacterium sp.]MBP7816783.1 hypothetical protein [Phenylobacterium sp.]MBP9230425.1 hypothetical protein [Phenylobacterium sp.]MBP9754913.1 hypothetical protein [Phenylobacterium sp.]
MAVLSRHSDHPILNATRARQGRFGRHVFWVLLVSTALAAMALFGAWTWQADNLASTEVNNARQPADAQAFKMGAPAEGTLQTAPDAPR